MHIRLFEAFEADAFEAPPSYHQVGQTRHQPEFPACARLIQHGVGQAPLQRAQAPANLQAGTWCELPIINAQITAVD